MFLYWSCDKVHTNEYFMLVNIVHDGFWWLLLLTKKVVNFLQSLIPHYNLTTDWLLLHKRNSSLNDSSLSPQLSKVSKYKIILNKTKRNK